MAQNCPNHCKERDVLEKVRADLSSLGSPLEPIIDESDSIFQVRYHDSFCQSTRTTRGEWIVDFWKQGYCYGSTHVALEDLAALYDLWLCQTPSVSELTRRIPNLRLHNGARVHEQGAMAFVAWCWTRLLLHASRHNEAEHEMLVGLYRTPEISRFLPFYSHDVLHLSQTTGYPYAHEHLPRVSPVREEAGLYYVLLPGQPDPGWHGLDATGTPRVPAWEVPTRLIALLPGLDLAVVHGTAKDVSGSSFCTSLDDS